MHTGITVNGWATHWITCCSVVASCAIGCTSTESSKGTGGGNLGSDSALASSGGTSGGSGGASGSSSGGATAATGGAAGSGGSGASTGDASTSAGGRTLRDAGGPGLDAAPDASGFHCGSEICKPGQYCYGYTPAGIGGAPGQPYQTCKSDSTGCATSCAQCKPGPACSCNDKRPLVYVSCMGL